MLTLVCNYSTAIPATIYMIFTLIVTEIKTGNDDDCNIIHFISGIQEDTSVQPGSADAFHCGKVLCILRATLHGLRLKQTAAF